MKAFINPDFFRNIRGRMIATLAAIVAALLPQSPALCTRRVWLTLGGMAAISLPNPTSAASGPISDGVRTRSGLMYMDFKEGSGSTPRFGQLLRFHYVGYAPNPQKKTLVSFDSSYDRRSAYLVKHGNGFTCQGIEEALHTMRVGGRRRVVLPPALGYTADKGPMPPGAGARSKLFDAVTAGEPLIFDLELVSIMDDLLDRGDYDDLVRLRSLATLDQAQASCDGCESRGSARRMWTISRRAFSRT